MEVQITRICNLAFVGLGAALIAAGPITAKRGAGADSLNKYVEARLAESSNQPQTAATIYGETLKAQPSNSLVAGRAYLKAIETGNFALALRAVQALELRGNIDAEMPFLIFADRFSKGDWKGAKTATSQMKSLVNFAFAAPLLDAWIITATGGDPSAELAKAKKNKTAAYYHEEQLILQHLAQGEDKQALDLLSKIVEANDARMGSIRLIAARHFLTQNDQKIALQMLSKKRTGTEALAFRSIQAGDGKKLAQKVDARIGAAFLFQRLSSDLGIQQAQFLSLVCAQTGAQIAAGNDYGHLVLGQAYRNAKQLDYAISEFAKIDKESPYHLRALNSEIAGMLGMDQHDAAEARLKKILARSKNIPEIHVLMGQVFQVSKANDKAAASFAEAIRVAEEKGYPDNILASYWLALGGAQEQAGIWPAGLNSLKKANALRPNSANILNYLGYAQLERRENTDEAKAAIERAYKLRSSSPAITDSLGWAYFLTGDHQRAVNYLEKALAGQPDDPTINEHLGDAYWTVGRKYEARYAWKSAKIFADSDDIKRLSSKIEMGLLPNLVSP